MPPLFSICQLISLRHDIAAFRHYGFILFAASARRRRRFMPISLLPLFASRVRSRRCRRRCSRPLFALFSAFPSISRLFSRQILSSLPRRLSLFLSFLFRIATMPLFRDGSAVFFAAEHEPRFHAADVTLFRDAISSAISPHELRASSEPFSRSFAASLRHFAAAALPLR